jgi:membrane protein DedA with SNARE-associated domain
MDDPAATVDVHDAPHPNVRRLVLASAAVLLAIGTFGSNIGPAWVDDRPAVLLTLSSRNRNLFGSVPFIDPLPYFAIGFVRILVAGVVLFFVGRWYGRRALTWFEGQVGDLPPVYRWFQRAIDRAGWLLVIAMPGSNLVCLMAGHRRMGIARFTSLLSIGIVLKLVVLWQGGKIFEDQIRAFLGWIEDYQWWVVAGLFALSFLTQGRRAASQLPAVVEEIEHPHEFPPDPE